MFESLDHLTSISKILYEKHLFEEITLKSHSTRDINLINKVHEYQIKINKFVLGFFYFVSSFLHLICLLLSKFNNPLCYICQQAI